MADAIIVTLSILIATPVMVIYHRRFRRGSTRSPKQKWMAVFSTFLGWYLLMVALISIMKFFCLLARNLLALFQLV